MTTVKEAFHRLIDDLSESEADLLFGMVKAQRDDPFLRALALAPLDDEPSSPEEDAEAEEAWQQYLAGEGRDWEDVKRDLSLG